MSEIEVGEYIRTKKGYIVKVKNIVCKDYPLEELQNGIICDDEDSTLILPKEITKHSKNIKELVKEGDYVNGMLVRRGRTANGEEKLLVGNHLIHGMALEVVNIKSIVTKEEFESREYKVGV